MHLKYLVFDKWFVHFKQNESSAELEIMLDNVGLSNLSSLIESTSPAWGFVDVVQGM